MPKKKKKSIISSCCNCVPKSFVISCKNPLRQSWDLVPMMLSIYNAVVIPFDISFGLPFMFLQLNLYIDVSLDVLFLIDNILMFFTSFVNKNGVEIFDHSEIFTNYTRKWRFVFDTLSLFGSYFFKEIHPYFKYFQLFKATRIARIGKMISSS